MSTIRRACPADAAPLAALSIEVWLATYVKHGVRADYADYVLTTFTPTAMEALIAAPASTVLVADCAEGIGGYLHLRQDSPAPAGKARVEIDKLYVQPRHQAAGLGRALLQAGLAGLPPGTPAWLMVSSENDRALRFYRGRGFAHVGDTHFRLNENAYLNHVFQIEAGA